jgi:hypothetical protein
VLLVLPLVTLEVLQLLLEVLQLLFLGYKQPTR